MDNADWEDYYKNVLLHKVAAGSQKRKRYDTEKKTSCITESPNELDGIEKCIPSHSHTSHSANTSKVSRHADSNRSRLATEEKFDLLLSASRRADERLKQILDDGKSYHEKSMSTTLQLTHTLKTTNQQSQQAYNSLQRLQASLNDTNELQKKLTNLVQQQSLEMNEMRTGVQKRLLCMGEIFAQIERLASSANQDQHESTLRNILQISRVIQAETLMIKEGVETIIKRNKMVGPTLQEINDQITSLTCQKSTKEDFAVQPMVATTSKQMTDDDKTVRLINSEKWHSEEKCSTSSSSSSLCKILEREMLSLDSKNTQHQSLGHQEQIADVQEQIRTMHELLKRLYELQIESKNVKIEKKEYVDKTETLNNTNGEDDVISFSTDSKCCDSNITSHQLPSLSHLTEDTIAHSACQSLILRYCPLVVRLLKCGNRENINMLVDINMKASYIQQTDIKVIQYPRDTTRIEFAWLKNSSCKVVGASTEEIVFTDSNQPIYFRFEVLGDKRLRGLLGRDFATQFIETIDHFERVLIMKIAENTKVKIPFEYYMNYIKNVIAEAQSVTSPQELILRHGLKLEEFYNKQVVQSKNE